MGSAARYAAPPVSCGVWSQPSSLRCSLGSSLTHTLELPHVFLLDLIHHLSAVDQIASEGMHRFAGNDRVLIICRLAPGNRTARRNQVRPPLNHQSTIP